MILGYVVKFHPNYLKDFDSLIQITLRGDLPHTLTFSFSSVTSLINTRYYDLGRSFGWFFLYEKWWSEGHSFNWESCLDGAFSCFFFEKIIYQRSRPAIQHLVAEGGFFFSVGMPLASTLIFNTLCDYRWSTRSKSVADEAYLAKLMDLTAHEKQRSLVCS